jgi:hypothetical protein
MNSAGATPESNGLNPTLTMNITEELRSKLLGFPKSKRWLEKKKAKSAMSYYAAGRNLVILQRATKKNPDAFLKWAKRQEEATDIQDKLDDIAKQLPTSEGYNFKNYIRGFLKSFGTQLPTADNTYTNKSDHPEYKKEEILQLLSYLQDKRHKLYVHIIAESGLRHHHVVQLKIRHLKEDLDINMIPTAIRLDPEHYTGKKLAGHTFLGAEAIKLLRECQEEGKIGKEPNDRVIPLQYSTLNETLRRAKKSARLDERIQPSHGLRKYFEAALDKAGIDHDLKMRIEGHNNGTRGKAYTTKDWDELRKEYSNAYPFINVHDPTQTKLAANIEATQNEMQQLKQRVDLLTTIITREVNYDVGKLPAKALQRAIELHDEELKAEKLRETEELERFNKPEELERMKERQQTLKIESIEQWLKELPKEKREKLFSKITAEAGS